MLGVLYWRVSDPGRISAIVAKSVLIAAMRFTELGEPLLRHLYSISMLYNNVSATRLGTDDAAVVAVGVPGRPVAGSLCAAEELAGSVSGFTAGIRRPVLAILIPGYCNCCRYTALPADPYCLGGGLFVKRAVTRLITVTHRVGFATVKRANRQRARLATVFAR